MIRPGDEIPVLLYREPVDFRKAINGLAVLVERELGESPFAPRIYAFVNRRRDRVKLLAWERNGFVLWMKRLERDRFPWPGGGAGTWEATGRELNWLLDGVDFFGSPPHREIVFETVL